MSTSDLSAQGDSVGSGGEREFITMGQSLVGLLLMLDTVSLLVIIMRL